MSLLPSRSTTTTLIVARLLLLGLLSLAAIGKVLAILKRRVGGDRIKERLARLRMFLGISFGCGRIPGYGIRDTTSRSLRIHTNQTI